MKHRDPFLSDDWKTIPLISREVRLDADGTPWTSQPDPVLRERIREVYRKLCEEGESGRQLVAVHQEFTAELIALIEKRSERTYQLALRVSVPLWPVVAARVTSRWLWGGDVSCAGRPPSSVPRRWR